MIILTRNFVDAQDATHSKMGMEGIITMRALSPYGRVRRERSFVAGETKFHNLITNNGLDRFGGQGAVSTYRYAHVGVGTAPPSVTDSQLANFISGVGGVPQVESGNSGAPDYLYSWVRITWTSSVGAIGNANLTECGISGTSGNGQLFSRELIRDSEGNPTSFPISSEESLQFTYELRLHRPVDDVVNEVNISGAIHLAKSRALNVGAPVWGPLSPSSANVNTDSTDGNMAYTGGLGEVAASSPLGSSLGRASSTDGAYGAGSYSRDTSLMWSPSNGNGTIRTIMINRQCCAFQIEYDPPITKTNVQTLILPQRLSWGRL